MAAAVLRREVWSRLRLRPGRFAESAHADDAPEWAVMVLVEHPNRHAFIDMVNDPAYRQAHVHRSEAVERALLRATDPIG